MKKWIAIVALLLPMTVWAYDFSVVVPGGQTLYFDSVVGGATVVCPHSSGIPTNPWGAFTKPTGDLVVPSTVVYNNHSYTITSISSFAFYGCDSLISVTIETGIATIGNSAFSYCSRLQTVSLPNTIASIGSQTFGNCNALQDVWITATNPPATASGAFFQTILTNSTLHVPCMSQTAYSTITPWNNFGTIDTANCTLNLTTGTNDPLRGTVTGAGAYPYGTVVMLNAIANTGYDFICWNDGDTLNPRIVSLTNDLHFKAMFFGLRHDTILLASHADTTFIHDTLTLRDTVTLHDTMVVTVAGADTVWRGDTIFAHDTLWRVDTVYPTFYRLRVLTQDATQGIGVGNAMLPAGSEVEICGLPLEGYSFTRWNDGVTENPRHVSLSGNLTYTAEFEHLSAENVPSSDWDLTVDGRTVTVACARGELIEVYDAAGRQLTSMHSKQQQTLLSMPSAGVFIVRVGDFGGRKVMVE